MRKILLICTLILIVICTYSQSTVIRRESGSSFDSTYLHARVDSMVNKADSGAGAGHYMSWYDGSQKQDSLKNPFYYTGGTVGLRDVTKKVGFGAVPTTSKFLVAGNKSSTDSIFRVTNRANSTLTTSTYRDSSFYVGTKGSLFTCKDYYIVNKAKTGYNRIFAYNESGADAVVDVTNVGTLSASGDISTSGGVTIGTTQKVKGTTSITFDIDGSNELTLSNAYLYPATNAGSGLGASTNGWNQLWLHGQTAQNIKLVTHTTSNTAGNSLTITSGTARVASMTTHNLESGGLFLYDGVSYGKAKNANIVLYRNGRQAASGTTVNNQSEAFGIMPMKNLVDNTNDTLFAFVLTSDSAYSIQLSYGVIVDNTTDRQSETGTMNLAGVVKTGTLTSVQTMTPAAAVQALSTGSLAGTWSASYVKASGTVYIIAAYDSSLNPTAGQMKMRYNYNNFSGGIARTQY